MSMNPGLAVRKVRQVIGDPTGKCYAAAEAVYHLSGKMLIPTVMPNEMGKPGDRRTHWFLRFPFAQIILDPTVHQFATIPRYELGRGCGFLTTKPSKRAQEIIKAVKAL